MIIIDEIPQMKLHKKPFYLPVNMKDRLKGNNVLLFTPNYDATVRLLNNPLIIKKHYNSYYLEKDVSYIINHEGYIDFSSTNKLIAETRLASPKLSSPQIIKKSNTIKSKDDKNKEEKKKENSTKIDTSDKKDNVKVNEMDYIDNIDLDIIDEGLFGIHKIKISYFTYIDMFEILHGIINKNAYKEIKEKLDSKYLNNVKKFFKSHPYHKFAYIANIILVFNKQRILPRQIYDKYNKAGVFNLKGLIYLLKEGMEQLPTDIFYKNRDYVIDLVKSNKDIKNFEKFTYYTVKENLNVIINRYSLDVNDAYVVYCNGNFYSVQGTNIKSFSIHELMHLYLNPIIYKSNNINRFKKYYNKDKNKAFIKNGYQLFETYLCETFVRCTDAIIQLIDKKQDNLIETDINKILSIDYLKNFSAAKEILLALNNYRKQNQLNFKEYMYLYFNDALNESSENIFVGYSPSDKVFGENKSYIKFNTGDNKNLIYIFEADQVYNNQLRKLFYDDRMRNREIFDIYDMIKQDVPYIKNTFIDIDKYKGKNLLIDTFFYNDIFSNKNVWKKDKGMELYFDLIDRYLNNNKLEKNGYSKTNIVLVPVLEWIKDTPDYLDFTKDINLLSLIIRSVKTHKNLLAKWRGINFVFMTSKGYFLCDLSTLNKNNLTQFRLLLDKLISGDHIEDKEPNKESKKAIMMNIIDRLEDDAKIKISKATGDSKEKEISKDEVIEKIDKAAEVSNNTEDTLDKLEDDERLKKILADLAAEEEDKVKINSARASRMMKAQDKSMDKVIKGKSIRDLLSESKEEVEIPKTTLHIDSVNKEWEDLRYINFEKVYNIDEDILTMIYSLSEKSAPIAILDIDIQDTSTSEDMKETYTVKMEDFQGQRFTIKFDVPLFVDDKFMLLRGNEKTINGQLTLIPILKTDDDTVQLVSNYKKIFIYRYGNTIGKSYQSADLLYKSLKKYDGKDIKIVEGDNTRICTKYELPMDYLDLAGVYNTIETKNHIIYFNQDTIREKYDVDESKGIPIAYDKKNKRVEYYDGIEHVSYSDAITSLILRSDTERKFFDIYNNTKPANKYTYSRANILNNKIPLIIIMAHSEGLEKSMKKANVKYTFSEKKLKNSELFGKDVIKFNDGYLIYDLDYNSSLLMNGIKECPTENYSIKEINNKSTYLDFLDLFGGRILSDGLDNFYDLMIDPITKEVLEKYNLPTDYIELLAYANFLLVDNKYVKHTDMTSRRYRSNELIAGYTYQALAESYGAYKTELKKRGSSTMTIKQTAVIDKVMLDPTCADLSSLNDLQNAESINALTYKGLSGMNYDRSYSLDKRGFDESMLNVVSMSTGFMGNVGITRQSTIDMNIEGKRGYIKTIDGDTNKFSITKTFGITEALTPFGPTRDDPMRSAMNFIQTSKHGMRTKNSMPLLITSGADMALPYITSNTFAFNAKADGKVVELTSDYMIVEYTTKGVEGNIPQRDFIDLRNNIKKNSNGGFYQSIKLDTDLKVGSKFKQNEILAYDRLSYSSKIGNTDDIAYNLGTLCKVALLSTDEGFEDSTIISEWLSDALASRVVIKKEYVLPKTTNIYYMVKKGQPIQEGEPLMIFQNAFDDEDVNLLLKNLSDDEELISEIGRIPIKSKVTGFVEDIKIYRTVEKSELSESLRKEIDKIEKPVNDVKKAMQKYDVYNPSKLEPTYVLEKSGKLKNVDEGVLVEFYLSYDDMMSVGDKMIYNTGCKGVVKDIFPVGKEPYSMFRPDEKIHTLVPYFGIANRIVCSIFNLIPMNKVIIELDRAIKTMCDIPFKYLDEE